MAKINIPFNDKNYSIDESAFSAAAAQLKSHLSTVMNGSGATINLDGSSYSIDSAKLSTATNDFVAHLGTIAGTGKKVVVNGVEYNIDSAKMASAVSELETVLGDLFSDGDGGESSDDPDKNEYGFYFNKNYSTIVDGYKVTLIFYEDGSWAYKVKNYATGNTETTKYDAGTSIYEANKVIETAQEIECTFFDNGTKVTYGLNDITCTLETPIPTGAYYGNLNDLIFYDMMPPTVTVGDAYVFGDYMYTYNAEIDGWFVVLATAETGITNFIPNYPVTDNNQTTYGNILTSINNKPVVELNSTFSNCINITNVTIPDNITNIGNSAFNDCVSLTNVNIHDGVTNIGGAAFNNCISLTNIIIPDSVTSIGSSAFNFCVGLTNITIPDGVTNIDSRVFYHCEGLTNVIIPDSITNIGSYAFGECTNLTSIIFNGSMAQWNTVSKDTYWKEGSPITEVVCSDGTVSLQ